MNVNPFKAYTFVFFIWAAILPAVTNSYAQSAMYQDGDEYSSQGESKEDPAVQVVDQVQDLAVKMQQEGKRLYAMEEEVYQRSTETTSADSSDDNDTSQEAPAQAAPEQAQALPNQATAPVEQTPTRPQVAAQASAPVQLAYAKTMTDAQPAAETNAQQIGYKPSFTEDESNDDLTLYDHPKVNQFTLAPEYSNITYKEHSLSVKEKGPFYGLYGAYYFRPMEAENWPVNVFHADANYSYGDIDYRSPSGPFNNIDDYLFELRLWAGKDFQLTHSLQMTPYMGLGYRFLYDSFGEDSPGGYDRRSQYFYLPIGFETKYQLTNTWVIGLNAEYDLFIRGWQRSYVSDVNPEYPDLNNEQDHGFGLRGSLDIVKKMDRYNLFISPYVRYWNIRQSKYQVVVGQYYESFGYEPANRSVEIGSRAGIEF